MTLTERRHLDRIVADEGRLDQVALAVLAKDSVDKLTLTHSLIDLDIQTLASLAQILL